jgi:hypothetical protein
VAGPSGPDPSNGRFGKDARLPQNLRAASPQSPGLEIRMAYLPHVRPPMSLGLAVVPVVLNQLLPFVREKRCFA